MFINMHFKIANEIHKRLNTMGIHLNKPFFVLGNLAPDISPSTITRPHSYDDSFMQTSIMIQELCSGEQAPDSPSFSMTMGKVVHYICDYFCLPHTFYFHDSFLKHLAYEFKQRFPKKNLLTYKQSQAHLTTSAQIIRAIKNRIKRFGHKLKGFEKSNMSELLYAIDTATMFASSICKISMKKIISEKNPTKAINSI